MPVLKFIHAPPLKTGRTKRKSVPKRARGPKPDEHYKQSVYYYWWAFLRLNKDYLKTCERGGKGRYAKTYADFGDVRGDDFWAWWKTHNLLFAEPPARKARLITDIKNYEPEPGTILIEVPTDKKLRLRMGHVRFILAQAIEDNSRRISRSEAKRQVMGKPSVASLDLYYRAYLLKQQYPKMGYAAIYQLVNGAPISIEEALKPTPRNVRVRFNPAIHHNPVATQMGYRYVRNAEQIIAHVGDGLFPKYYKSLKT